MLALDICDVSTLFRFRCYLFLNVCKHAGGISFGLSHFLIDLGAPNLGSKKIPLDPTKVHLISFKSYFFLLIGVYSVIIHGLQLSWHGFVAIVNNTGE
jgi:hypothetical protein